MHPWSIARRLFVGQLMFIVFATMLVTWAVFVHNRDTVFNLEQDRMLHTARLMEGETEVIRAYSSDNPTEILQPYSLRIMKSANLAFATFMDTKGTRLTYWDPSWIGTQYPGTIQPAVNGQEFTEVSSTGRAGLSARAVVPIRVDGNVVGILTVGSRVSELDILAQSQIPAILIGAGVLLIFSSLASYLLSQYLKRVTFGMGPEQMSASFNFIDTALHNVTEGIVLISQHGRVRLYNDKAAELLRWPIIQAREPGFDPQRTTVSPNASATGAVGLLVNDIDLPEALKALMIEGRDAEDERYFANGRILVVNQHTIDPSSRGAVRGAVSGTVITLHDATDVQALSGELENTRSLTDALRSQTHEHANRLHTVLSLLELGHTEQAKGVVSEAVGASDQREGSAGVAPVMEAVLTGKAAQARERGIDLDFSIELTRRTNLGSHILITILGNLVDNAMDAIDSIGSVGAADSVGSVDAVVDSTVKNAAQDGAQDGALDAQNTADVGEEQQRWIEVDVYDSPAEEGRWLTIMVADSGPGVPQALIDRIFERGFSTKDRGETGRGHGLWLVNSTAKRLGGTVSIAQDSGTVFTVEIPIPDTLTPAATTRPAVVSHSGQNLDEELAASAASTKSVDGSDYRG
ncbi:ATP-binding protein [Neomicrococcus lactis]|uniref:histidine kinase n=1 Tax=Neomicrococcus lactis TaxID=732241 RepID=A0A7W8YAP6_9MICC|nr:sensor histidine kinase regulating citrate/malate metabolism [Neomicrococcus lactis]